MPSIQYRMVEGLFKIIGVNKMLAKEGEAWEKLLKDYSAKQKKPLKVPYSKLKDEFEIAEKKLGGVPCYVVKKKNAVPKIGVLYLFGGGYILPPDPGDLILCGQIAKNCNAQVWFPLYPMAPGHRLVETLNSTLEVYKDILDSYAAGNTRIFGTSSGGGQALSMCAYIKHEKMTVPMPGKGIIFFMIGAKVRKRGAILIYCIVRGCIFGGFLPYIILYFVADVAAELVLWKTGYGNTKGLTAGYVIIQALASIGSTIYPYALAYESVLQTNAVSDGREGNIQQAAGMLKSWGVFLLLAGVVVSSLIGAVIGKRIVKKHLN
ncbi:MAG: MptD family putative ECF transporter S component [Butyrivibrio sp.]|nr:MptD family putative ECF transporter S component [Butyrivibrio sp.]